MTINPVDMQVILPRVGEVNKVLKVSHEQQQLNQQIIAKTINEELAHRQKTVQQTKSTEHNNVQNNDANKKQGKGQKSGKAKTRNDIARTEETEPGQKDPNLGHLFDIKI